MMDHLFLGTETPTGAKAKPMDCEERMVKQVEMTVAASPGTKVFVCESLPPNLQHADAARALTT